MKPDCKNCIFFIPGRYTRTDTCSKFVIYRGRGKLLYEWAESARFRDSKCGPGGKLYIAKKDAPTPEKHINLANLLE